MRRKRNGSMGATLKLNLHCHSDFSDGALSPEALAGRLADEGAAVAALTDHDTVEGSVRFREALSLRGVAFVDAVELTTFGSFGEVHLLAYGIDITSPELLTALSVARGEEDRELNGFLNYLRRAGTRPNAGKLSTEAAIQLTHRAGGIAVLAHPLNIVFESGNLVSLLDSLTEAGLDGLEAYYGPYSREERAALAVLAEERGLCVSVGTDFHVPDDPEHRAVLAADEKIWLDFRDRLLFKKKATVHVPEYVEKMPKAPAARGETVITGKRTPILPLGKYSARVISASVGALALLVIALFVFSIPYFEKTLLDRKKEMIRELTAEAVSLIAEYVADETTGKTDRRTAQRNAIEHIRGIRYGSEGKDYFWITDMAPRMVMHPYRTELEGTDVSDYQDDNGLRVFREFTRAVRDKEEGYVEYLWQWKDDASRIVPKLSFVKRVEPWGWVIGTGIYLEDVRREIDALAGRMIALSVFIALILVLLLAFIASQSLRAEEEKRAAEFAVRESKERYRALAEASSEGMAIIVDGTCTFANAPFLELSGYAASEIVLVGISELLAPYEGDEDSLLEFLAALPSAGSGGERPDVSMACLLKTRSGAFIDIVAHTSPFFFAGKQGAVLSTVDARVPASLETKAESGEPLTRAAALLSMGSFRARFHRRAFLLQADPIARLLLGLADEDSLSRVSLENRFADIREWDSFYAELVDVKTVVRKPVRLLDASSDRTDRDVLLTAFVEETDASAGRFISGIIEDQYAKTFIPPPVRETVVNAEASAGFLDEKLTLSQTRVSRVSTSETVEKAAARMTRDGCGALIIQSDSGADIGVLTDADIRSRVVAEGLSAAVPAGSVMTAPLIAVREDSTCGQALALMRKKGVGHIAVRKDDGPVIAIVSREDLSRVQADGYAALAAEAGNARDKGELKSIRERTITRTRILTGEYLRPRRAAALVSLVADAIIQRVLSFAETDLGPAPADFAFLMLGSGGRSELLPSSDQDNAIVYASSGEHDAAVRSYFRELGSYVCDSLYAIGIPYCPGGVMAKNDKWRGSLDEWVDRFISWIRTPDSEEMLALNLSFDFRAIGGNPSLAVALRAEIAAALEETPAFFTHLARDASRRPAGVPQTGIIQGTNAEAEIDLKEIASRFVQCARLYALKSGIVQTNTYARYAALSGKGVISPSLADDCADSLEFLTGLRIEQYPGAWKTPLKSLKQKDETLLRNALTQISLLQKKLAFDFPGAAV